MRPIIFQSAEVALTAAAALLLFVLSAAPAPPQQGAPGSAALTAAAATGGKLRAVPDDDSTADFDEGPIPGYAFVPFFGQAFGIEPERSDPENDEERTESSGAWDWNESGEQQ